MITPDPVVFTVSVNCEAWVFPFPDPVTVMAYDPAGVDVEVLSVKVLVNAGFPDGGLNDAVTPEGRPDAVSATV